MSRLRAIPLAGLLLTLSLSPAFAAADQSPWLEIHSAHFTVITDAGEKKGREVAFRFEQMRAVFASLLGRDRLNQPVPLTILAFKSDKTYYQLAPLRDGQPIAEPGFFLPGDDQDFVALNLFEDNSWDAVAHDFAHMLLNFNYPPAQGWFDEGLAEYFAAIHLDNKQVEIGGDPELGPSAAQDLLGNPHEVHAPHSLTELLGAQVWLSLPDLFGMKHDTASFNEGTHHTLYYAESWMVMHYLLHEKKLPETGEYFNLVLNQHMLVEDAIQKAFGMSSDDLEKAVKDYFHSLTALQTALDTARIKNPDPTQANSAPPVYVTPSPIAPDDSAVVSKPMLEADARALYAGVQIRIPERRELGLKDLHTLATAPTPADVRAEAKRQDNAKKDDDPNNPYTLPTNAVGNELAHRMLAWDHIQHGEFDDAVTELGDAAALNHNDLWVRYYLSVLKQRMAVAKHTDMPGLANMMLDLRAVLEWYPEFADAYDLLAQARNEGGSTPAAMQAERAAMTLSPRNENYVYHLALIYIASKKWEAAEAQLERLRASSNPQMATMARERLAQANSERKYGIAGAAADQPKLAPQKTPFDILDEDAAKRAAAEQTAQSGIADRRPTKFLHGRLLAVDCNRPPAAILLVAGQSGTMKLRAPDYKNLVLIGADNFSCAWKDRTVNVNYKPGGSVDGDVVSLEMK